MRRGKPPLHYLSILILRGRFLKRSARQALVRRSWLSILILRGRFLKRKKYLANNVVKPPFNPHFTRTLLETDASGRVYKGEPLLSILILRGRFLKLAAWACTAGSHSTFNPHFTRTLLETFELAPLQFLFLFFQSSFYEDAS